MRLALTILFVLLNSSIFGQTSNLETTKIFFKEHSPCGMPVYCYEYEFVTEGRDLIIKTKLFNSKNRTLTETVTYKIPSHSIKRIDFFNYNSGDIYIVMDGANIIKMKNEVITKESFMPFDFDKRWLDSEKKEAFKKVFLSLINELKKQ